MKISVNERPLVTFALFSYNAERFTREAVESALAQTYSPLEIILSDDCSTDGTFQIMSELASSYHGPHRVVLNRNPTNLGGPGHVNRLLEMARGEFIVQAEGDDISVPNRTEKLVDCWLKSGRSPDLVCSYFAEINELGVPTGFVKRNVMYLPDLNADVSTWWCGATGATASYTARLYRKYGPLHRDVHSVDWVLPFRAWLEGGVELIKEPLILHRTHGASLSYMARNPQSVGGRRARYLFRRRLHAGELAIAQEWLKAWRIAKGGENRGVEQGLERLIRLRSAQLDAFDASAAQVVRSLRTVLQLGGIGAALKLCYRQILRVY